MNYMVNVSIITILPTILFGIGALVIQVWDIKTCMARMEEKMKGHIELHEALADREKDR